jgi:hypothetical protein
VSNELGEIDGTTAGSDDGRLDGTVEDVSVGNSLEVLLGFRLGNIDGNSDGSDVGEELGISDGVLVGMCSDTNAVLPQIVVPVILNWRLYSIDPRFKLSI